MTLVLLAAPAATAGAICLDRSRGTLTHLLVTDLTDVEIVLGKLAARLTPIVVLIAAALPVMELLTLLGGVDPAALLGAFLVTLGVAVLGCCLALIFSLWVRRTHEALLATYTVWGLWLLGRPMLDQINRVGGLTLNTPSEFADPYVLAFAPYWRPGSVEWQDYLRFLAATCGTSVVLALVAVRTMRRLCTREVVKKPASRRGAAARSGALTASPASRISDRMGPTLDFNPVLWREWHRNRPARWARIVGLIYVVLALTFSLMAILSGRGNDLPAWVNGLQVAIGLLFLSVISATSLAEERVRGSLDILLTTPLETRRIVLGKWMGTYRLVPPLAILPVAVIVGVANVESERLPLAIVMLAFVLSSGAAVTSLGLAMATWFSRLGRAVGLTVSLYLLVTVGWMLMIMTVAAHPNAEAPMMGSPFYWAGVVTFRARVNGVAELWDPAVGWTLAYAVSAGIVLAATLATFDRCLGRVERQSRRGPMPRRKRERSERRRAEA